MQINAALREEEETIPVLDVGAYLRGDAGALAALAGELRLALEDIGFFFTVNHL